MLGSEIAWFPPSNFRYQLLGTFNNISNIQSEWWIIQNKANKRYLQQLDIDGLEII